MPSGKTHDGLTWGAVFPLALGIGYFGDSWLGAMLFGAGFLFGGLMFGPDLDLPSVQTRRWGPLRGIWTPYQRMFRHRSPWTHGLFLGPVVRVLYLGCWGAAVLLLLWAVARILGAPGVDAAQLRNTLALGTAGFDPELGLYGLLGIWGGSALHSVADSLVSGIKRMFRVRKKRRR